MAARLAPYNSGVAALPFLHLPLVISESLMSSVAAAPGHDSGTHCIVSILLSSADLAKLQLFSVDGLGLDAAAAHLAAPDHALPLPADMTSPGNELSFQNPLILRPVADRCPGGITFPILKSKSVVEAERLSAEHRLLKQGAVSTSPRVRKKAVSMDEMALSEELNGLESVVPDAAEGRYGGVEMSFGRVRAKIQLPALELAALPCPGLQEKAESLRKKHFERILSRTLSECTQEEARIDFKASPADKFLLQVMPWELTTPVTSVTTPIAIPFLWEDVPGKPKPRSELPFPSPSLPLPPRLLRAPQSTAAAAAAVACPGADVTESSPHRDGEKASLPDRNNSRHGRHRKNTHSWHALHNLFSCHHRCPLQVVEACLEASQSSDNQPLRDLKESPAAGDQTSGENTPFSTTVNSSKSASSDLSPSIATVSEDPLSSCGPSLNARYELPPLYVAPVLPLTAPYGDFGPHDDDCSKHTLGLDCLAKFFRKGRGHRRSLSTNCAYVNCFGRHGKASSESNSYLLDDAEGHQTARGVVCGIYADEYIHNAHSKAAPSDKEIQSIYAQLSAFPSTMHQSCKLGKHRKHRGAGSTRVFLKLRTRGSEVTVATYRAIKHALLLRRGSHSKFLNHTQLQYHTLE